MDKKQNTKLLAALCVGCKFSTIASGREFVCNRPGQTIEALTAAAIDAFFGDKAGCFVPAKIK